MKVHDAFGCKRSTCGSVVFGGIKALKLVPLKVLALRAEMPTARFLDVMARDGPSNSIFCISSSMVFRALEEEEAHI